MTKSKIIEGLVVHGQAAVGIDVDLDALQDVEVGILLEKPVHFGALDLGRGQVQALLVVFGQEMIADAQVLQPDLPGDVRPSNPGNGRRRSSGCGCAGCP